MNVLISKKTKNMISYFLPFIILGVGYVIVKRKKKIELSTTVAGARG